VTFFEGGRPIVKSAVFAALTALSICLAGPVFAAEDNPDDNDCVNLTGQSAVDACTRVIQSGRYSSVDVEWAYYDRGTAQSNMGNYQAAIDDFNLALQLSPSDADAWGNRGNAYRALGQYDRAIQDLDHAIAIRPGKYDFNNRGSSYNGLTRYQEAVADFDQAIALDPDFSAAYYNRGIAHNALKQYKLAVKDFDFVIKKDPKDSEAFLRRSVARRALGDSDGADADLARARALDPKVK